MSHHPQQFDAADWETYDAAEDIPAWASEELGENIDMPAHALSQGAEVQSQTLVRPEAGVQPPERVRFTMPLTLRTETGERNHESAVLNLSTSGIACSATVTLEPGDRVWAGFSLSLAGKPLQLLCEVVWRRLAPENDSLTYGLRFLNMTQDEANEIARSVRERAEGRAGAWPLPLDFKPAVIEPTVVRRGANPWLAALGGLLAGAGLAVVLAYVPPVEALMAADPAPIADAKPLRSETPTALPNPATPQPPAALPDGNVAKPVAALPDGSAGKPMALADAADEYGFGQAPTVDEADDAEPEPREDLPTQAQTEPQESTNTPFLRPQGRAGEMSMTLKTATTPRGHVAFWLSEPRRLVIDVPNTTNGFRRQHYEVDHPLASRLRIGNHPDKVRFVLEVDETISPILEATPGPEGLEIRLRRE